MKIYTLYNIFFESVKDNPVWTSKKLRASKWKQYILRKSVSFKLSNGSVIKIEEGFEWDLSSVPRLFWAILPPNGDFIVGALIHDYLYQNSELVIEEFEGDSKKARKFADTEMLLWSKAVNGTSKISLQKIDNYTRFYGVRLFGGFVWNKKTKI